MTVSKNLLNCGDFNICLNLKYDKKGGNREIELRAKDLKSFMEEVDIIDIWRLRHPDLLQYSRRIQKQDLYNLELTFGLFLLP